MSSMVRIPMIASLLLAPVSTASVPLAARDSESWDQARASLVASQPGPMTAAIDRWQRLTASTQFSFDDYAGFLLTYPGFPMESRLRGYAEAKLVQEAIPAERVVAYFDRFPPLTNPAKAQYALALSVLGRPQAEQWAREAWRGGSMSATAEATLFSLFGRSFTQDDHDARMDALLWDRDASAATRQFSYVSPASRTVFMARMSAAQGSDPAALGIPTPGNALSDPGYVYNIVRQMRKSGRAADAVNLLAMRPPLASRPVHADEWIEELLVNARSGGSRAAQRIAASAIDAFDPGTDISTLGYGLRDDYTSLMWLGGTSALWDLGDADAAAPLFYQYGAAARTPQTRSKGFYWAGLASDRAGDSREAQRYFAMAADYPDQFYGMLALERLGRPIPNLKRDPAAVPSRDERAAFYAKPLTAAVREAAREAPWSVTVRFFREIADRAETEGEHVLVHELAESLGRRDLAVINGEKAQEHGYGDFHAASFPTLPSPPGSNWTMVHAITRQESQFAQNAISHAGARGLMQLMPGTAREQAGKLGMTYMSASLIDDAGYNMRLGDGYFTRMLNYYGGSYPLAVAAYNAGPGNVNKWLARNGDPRSGGVGWVDWIERIPIFETKNYVQRVLENAVVYQHMNPDKAGYGGPKSISWFLGKNSPG
ncbi:lytic transglycosylase [Croceicoccus estronivorus]|uniref:lytic transglycosylase domain-containing protein n=1 Tax=Croceicoccus estronivorus TaxID=1172626 RepID=UPI0008368526|nr:lytic transglycosylase domain-containing protein [Croceicoccus estronivorus]OCC23043.1 lytic transglycosylase [Croceicoccus estronivorus]